MSSAGIEGLVKRDRLIVTAALGLVTIIAWVYLFSIANSMAMPSSGMPEMAGMPDMPDMPGMAMAAATPMLRVWTATDYLLMFVMWAVMMVGMMTPSAAPMILIYARVARHSEAQGKPLAATGWFVAGYLLSWTAFSVVATVLQGQLDRAAWLTPMMSASSNRIGGMVLIVAGLYQWTPFKDACLKQCRSPLAFIQYYGGFKRNPAGSLKLGLRHGLYCIGCCWALMALLFAGGVMNITWIAAIGIFVLIEKLVPSGTLIPRIAGAALVVAGVVLFAKA
jgi:predicted metal-binding membrane protein